MVLANCFYTIFKKGFNLVTHRNVNWHNHQVKKECINLLENVYIIVHILLWSDGKKKFFGSKHLIWVWCTQG